MFQIEFKGRKLLVNHKNIDIIITKYLYFYTEKIKIPLLTDIPTSYLYREGSGVNQSLPQSTTWVALPMNTPLQLLLTISSFSSSSFPGRYYLGFFEVKKFQGWTRIWWILLASTFSSTGAIFRYYSYYEHLHDLQYRMINESFCFARCYWQR